MLLFCPSCSNILFITEGSSGFKFACKVCPYAHHISKIMASTQNTKLKEVDAILGGSAAWENVDATDERCPKCEHPRAYFFQMQTRSADEPMTIFYKCCDQKCGFQWRE